MPATPAGWTRARLAAAPASRVSHLLVIYTTNANSDAFVTHWTGNEV
jgi:hypothetical protein